jgi:alkyl sulfatase BDS1-like metallo-beta-lactamase superfamily hydrolase
LAAKARLLALAAGDLTSPGFEIGGDPQVLAQLIGVLDQPEPAFDIITP